MESLAKKIRVLIVDDSKFMRDLLEKILSTDPDILIVGKASDPYVARDLIKKVCPHVLTLDIMMPGMDGFEVMRELKRDHDLSKIPVVIVSAKPKSTMIELFGPEGISGYISKPFEAKEMLQVIKEILGT